MNEVANCLRRKAVQTNILKSKAVKDERLSLIWQKTDDGICAELVKLNSAFEAKQKVKVEMNNKWVERYKIRV